mmetsp:Transcript_16120/g.49270  ORF Transcript_16120/g.49270 Transcript_16120/m.49270 type:complete len:246 (-) Transcript_16120:243-980(-)
MHQTRLLGSRLGLGLGLGLGRRSPRLLWRSAPTADLVWVQQRRAASGGSSRSKRYQEQLAARNQTVALYMFSIVVGFVGLSYAAVPLYKAFCQMTGFGGTTQRVDEKTAAKVKPVENGRLIRITFAGNTASTLQWTFRPQQVSVKVVPGETALAFFRAKNKTDLAVTGVATYNVYPPQAGIYFNKIQCFCFEEQRLKPKEEIDMPVFFYIDPEFMDDPAMRHINNITLSYTFFKTGEVPPTRAPT